MTRSVPDRRRRLLLAVVAILFVAGAATVTESATVWAHEPGTTGIELEIRSDGIEGIVDLPLEPLEAALGAAIATDPLGLSTDRDLVVGYVADHFEVTTAGDAWDESFGRLTAITAGGIESVRLEVILGPPDGVAEDGANVIDGAVLSYDALIEHDDGQVVFVTAFEVDGAVSLTAVLDSDTTSTPLGSATSGGAAHTAWTMLGEGFEHVLDGADHMLFLLMLIVPAPLIARGGKWHLGGRRPRAALRRVVHVASAFTVGHSATLVASALGWVSLPTRSVEVAIGVSVAVSAVHAIRPLVSSGELWIAGSFGLVHGLAFAGILDDLGLGQMSLVSLAGFNLGVEAAQLAVIGLTFPSLMVLARSSRYLALRNVTATVAFGAAAGWVLERVGVVDSPFGSAEQVAVDHLWWVVGVLALAALASVAIAAGVAEPAPTTNPGLERP